MSPVLPPFCCEEFPVNLFCVFILYRKLKEISIRYRSRFGEEMDPVLSTLQQLLGVPDELEKHLNASTRTYVSDTKAMASTPVDLKEYPNSYVFILDMPGVKSNNIKVFL